MYAGLAIIAVAISAFNTALSVKAKKKLAVVLNGAFYSLLIMALIGFYINSTTIDNYSKEYDTYHGGFLGSVKYEGTSGDYYIIVKRGFMYSDRLAVPIESVDISPVSKLCKNVILCCGKDTELYENEITINSRSYYLCDTAEKIMPDFFNLLFIVLVVDAAVTVIFNLVLFIANIIMTLLKQ